MSEPFKLSELVTDRSKQKEYLTAMYGREATEEEVDKLEKRFDDTVMSAMFPDLFPKPERPNLEMHLKKSKMESITKNYE